AADQPSRTAAHFFAAPNVFTSTDPRTVDDPSRTGRSRRSVTHHYGPSANTNGYQHASTNTFPDAHTHHDRTATTPASTVDVHHRHHRGCHIPLEYRDIGRSDMERRPHGTTLQPRSRNT